jgi:predicted methyltransferase MtxX (methanogen marker protein 4)
MTLKKFTKSLRTKPNILIKRKHFDVIIVDTNSSIRVSDRGVDGNIIVKCVVVSKTELGKGCISCSEFDVVWTNDKPEENREYYYGNNDVADYA